MTEEREELMFEILKRMQADIAKHTYALTEIRAVLGDMRVELHSIRGDLLRQAHDLAELRTDMDRVKTRLDLVEA